MQVLELPIISIWYPEQDIKDVKPYPWTLFQTQGDCATIEHITLVNAYNGFNSAPSELHYVLDSYMTALNKGIEIHVCTDIGRVENVRISPEYWGQIRASGCTFSYRCDGLYQGEWYGIPNAPFGLGICFRPACIRV